MNNHEIWYTCPNCGHEYDRRAWYDFYIRARFLTPDELAAISTFPEQYFTDPLLRLTKKEIVKLIGNAVPPKWAELMIKPVIEELQQILLKQLAS